VQIVSQFAAERVGLVRHQLRQQLLLPLIVQPGRVPTGVRTRPDPTFFTIALPDATCRCRGTGHDPGDVVAFQAALKELDDPSSHRQGKSFHAGPLLAEESPQAYVSSGNRARGEDALL
jgi:hypothetical protein